MNLFYSKINVSDLYPKTNMSTPSLFMFGNYVFVLLAVIHYHKLNLFHFSTFQKSN